MARIETKNFMTISQMAEEFGKPEDLVRYWVNHGEFSPLDILIFNDETYVKTSAIKRFKSRISE